ncbi:hypothetical protein ACSS6W_004206 [Trichoderma asperelloides]|nr:hypothetical protein LI328DRAFT_134693 [Trichoderma asperelloides]
MGLAKAVVKFIAIPIIIVVFIAFVIIFIRSKREQKKLSKHAEAEALPQFNCGPVPPPAYTLPAKPAPAIVQQGYTESYHQT